MCQSPTLHLCYKWPLIEAFACPENQAEVIAELRKENSELRKEHAERRKEIAELKAELARQASRIELLEALVEQLVRKESGGSKAYDEREVR